MNQTFQYETICDQDDIYQVIRWDIEAIPWDPGETFIIVGSHNTYEQAQRHLSELKQHGL